MSLAPSTATLTMPARKPAPASATKPDSAWLRNFKAKLPLLKQPAVWASALLMMLSLIFLAHYLRESASLQLSSSGSDLASNASEADRSNAPSLSDPSSLLEASAADAPPAGANDVPSSIFQTDLLSALLASSSPAADAKAKNSPQQPASASANSGQAAGSPLSNSPLNSPVLNSLALDNPALDSLTLGANLPAAGVSPASSLQSALDRSAGVLPVSSNPLTAQLAQSNAQTAAQSNAQTDGRARSNADVTRLYGQQLGAFSQLEQPYRPATSPQVGGTGYVVPPVLTMPSYPSSGLAQSQFPNQFSNQFPSQFPSQFPNAPLGSYSSPSSFGAYPQPTFVSPQPLVQPAPFSVPRTPPGRYIGNGQINTFSNP